MTFLRRRIDVKFALNGDTFDGENNTLSLTGLRCQATVNSYSGSVGSFASQLSLRVSGMLGDDMAKLSTLGFQSGIYRRNAVNVFAGDDASGMTLVFAGNITSGIVDYNSMPDVGVEIIASAFATAQYDAIAASSYKGSMSVGSMIEAIAKAANLGFQNNGVAAVLSNHAVGGTAVDQIKDIGIAAGINVAIENKTVFIWPKDGSRDDSVTDVRPENGLVGYPMYSVRGIDIITLFNPDIQVGRQVRVTSSIPRPSANAPAQANGSATAGTNGIFKAYGVTHDLSSETPNGPWFSRVNLAANNFNAIAK
jgi:hypothetical protein